MAITLLFLFVFVCGLALAVSGGLLVFFRKGKRPGFILLVVGILVTLSSMAGFLSLVIATRTMG